MKTRTFHSKPFPSLMQSLQNKSAMNTLLTLLFSPFTSRVSTSTLRHLAIQISKYELEFEQRVNNKRVSEVNSCMKCVHKKCWKHKKLNFTQTSDAVDCSKHVSTFLRCFDFCFLMASLFIFCPQRSRSNAWPEKIIGFQNEVMVFSEN